MAYDEKLADRIAIILGEKEVLFEEKKMMGGLCYMVDDKMCLGLHKDEMMARINPDDMETYVEKNGVEQMTMGGRAMKGFLLISPDVLKTKKQLAYWVQQCLDFNPLAKSSKKKKK